MPRFQLPPRAASTLAALLLALLALADYLHWRDEQQRLAELLAASGIGARYPAVGGEVAREPDPELARLRVARALFAGELDPAKHQGLSSEEVAHETGRGLERLALARDLAAETLPSRPASWRAAAILGGATFLDLARRRDPRAGARAELWEEPLLAAHRLAPGHPEPPRLLAAAYLGNWSRLGPEAKERAGQIVATAFRDPATFDLLAESWLRVAPSLAAALDAVPSSPLVWTKLEQIVLRRGDLERYRDVHERWHGSLRAAMEQNLAQGDRHLRLGEIDRAVERYAVVATLPPGHGFRDLLQAAVERTPAGERRSSRGDNFRLWLEWALDLCALRQCPLPPAVIARLAELATDLSPAQRAFAALAGGTDSLAELYERKASSLAVEEWQPYLIYKARHLAARGHLTEAGEALARLAVSAADRPLYWQARLELALQQGDADAVARARARLAELANLERSGERWRSAQLRWWQELPVDRAGDRLTIELHELVEQGAVLEASWDGELAGFFYVTPGERLRLSVPVMPGLHRVEIRRLQGKGVRPGRISLGAPTTAG